MATIRKTKVGLEVLLVRAEVRGVPEKTLLKSRNMVYVDIVWPQSGPTLPVRYSTRCSRTPTRGTMADAM